MTYREKLANATAANNSLLCVGLDPDIEKLPAHLRQVTDPLFAFNRAIIDATVDLVCAFKPNSAFYEAAGEAGLHQLKLTTDYLRKKYPTIPILLDFKRGDIGNTNSYYAQFAFDYLGVDAVTIQPYLGREANEVYLSYKDKGIIVLCRTSNPGAGEFQDLKVGGKKLYRVVAEAVMNEWNENTNCLLVIGSPYPEELAEVRAALGDDAVFLVPGVGTQGGDMERTVRAGVNSRGDGMMVNSSRGVLFASDGEDFAEAARAEAEKLKEEINKYRGGPVMAYADDVATFKEHFVAAGSSLGTFDPETVHHEFVSGMHGQKVDFDSIPDSDPLFAEWVDVVVATLKEFYPADRLKNVVLVSVANGTNRVVPKVAEKIGNGASFLLTEKESPKSAKLTAEAAAAMSELKDRFFVVLEDVGTKGTTSASVVRALRAAGGHDIEVINTWQRREQLEELAAIDAPYHAIIKEILPTYTPAECHDNGLCAAGSTLIAHAK